MLRRFLHPAVDLWPGEAAILQPVGEVVVDAHVRVKRVVLEHHRDIPVRGFELVDHPIPDRQLALGDRLEPGDHAQQRGLAAARGADEDDHLAVVDAQVDVGHRPDIAGVNLVQPAHE
jgi:hypothetical protein